MVQNIEHSVIFPHMYENKLWGDDKNEIYNGSSGEGSTLENTLDTWVPFLRNFIKENTITSVTDLGCGSFMCGPYIYDDLNVKYHGYDVYDKFKSIYNGTKYAFTCTDFFKNKESIEGADLCILKDVLCHWTIQEINEFLDYIVSANKFKYILLCNGSQQIEENHEVDFTGQWRPLSSKMLPFKKYNPEVIYTYLESGRSQREVCLLQPQPQPQP